MRFRPFRDFHPFRKIACGNLTGHSFQLAQRLDNPYGKTGIDEYAQHNNHNKRDSQKVLGTDNARLDSRTLFLDQRLGKHLQIAPFCTQVFNQFFLFACSCTSVSTCLR